MRDWWTFATDQTSSGRSWLIRNIRLAKVGWFKSKANDKCNFNDGKRWLWSARRKILWKYSVFNNENIYRWPELRENREIDHHLRHTHVLFDIVWTINTSLRRANLYRSDSQAIDALKLLILEEILLSTIYWTYRRERIFAAKVFFTYISSEFGTHRPVISPWILSQIQARRSANPPDP